MSEEEPFSSAQLLKGHLDLLILATVREEPAHGYAIIERLRLHSGGTFDLPEGTVYPALHRLELAGLLTSRWSDEHSRRRRIYSLTTRGQAEFQRGSHKWSQFAESVALVLFGKKREGQAW
ncbi:MAG TPA: helix-turn-helix transcriptional regulator [Ktedonobacteraceae bacterium]